MGIHLYHGHFTLGFPYDRALPGVYRVEITNKRQKDLNNIIAKLIHESTNFHLKESLSIYNLALSAIGSLSESIWFEKKEDQRIITTLDYLEINSKTKITSQTLADRLFMSKSAFSRLFKSDTGKSPSKYLTQLRIDKACNLLHHTSSSIDTIAEQCGFSDRYHLSKVFSKIKKTSPAAFRRRIGYY